MRLEFVPYPFLIGINILFILITFFWMEKRKPVYLVCFSMFWMYLLLIVGLTVFPIPLPKNIGGVLDDRQRATYILSRVNLLPFYFGRLFDLSPIVIFENLVGNILLTIPFGFGIRYIFCLSASRALCMAFALGLGIEATQLAVSLLIGAIYRGVDINDALLNALGVLIGYGIFQVLSRFSGWMRASAEE